MISRLAYCFTVVCFFVGETHAQSYQYRWANGAQFVYDVQIVADLPDAVETLSGRIVYQVKSTEAPSKISFRGGLRKSSKKKPGASSSRTRGPFGDVFGAPPGFGSPFARKVNPFKGLEQTSNQIIVASKGKILAIEGTSQLPYLLGNLSLLVFEPLPDAGESTWKVESGVTITEKQERSASPAPAADPFAADLGLTKRWLRDKGRLMRKKEIKAISRHLKSRSN